jgi:hypothetical protein
MAQFNRPELGGSGQWMRGGMTLVGDMFNYGLKSKVDGLCSELSQLFAAEPFMPDPSASQLQGNVPLAGGDAQSSASLFVRESPGRASH